ncbi:alkyl sulfatase C-terminal domain-containing protein [Micromonospora sp. NBC_01796]|uniref:alkyl sulfatase C-terminal domain-containing protein n=1 Tax=Micromonospora sp. NBC_01796 TaxID=2975987 RepID=UPI002DDB6CEC|nr:alkyl sulfatase C-terminal domain-containing protein [Micromonospora sp. NBC_01796]WSA86050.1 SCP2 sterol-binding domain-containing protein [Micromonospora sp. NBC_01796]
MASVDECRQALHDLAARMDANAAQVRDHANLERTLACRVSDLDYAFHGRISDGRLLDLADGDDPDAKIALTTTSEDLVALVAGHLDIPKALAARRVSVDANPFDLLKLRKLL